MRASSAHGRIGITFCPGAMINGSYRCKCGSGRRTGRRRRLGRAAGVDPGRAPLSSCSSGFPCWAGEVHRRGILWRHSAHCRFQRARHDFERQWVIQGQEIRTLLRDGEDVLVHCKGGLGRAGMIAARLWWNWGNGPGAGHS